MNKSTFRRTKLAVLAMLLWSTVSVADEGPFGITWGMSKSQVKALGVDMEPSSAKLSLESFKVKKLPKSISIAEFYGLTFDTKHGLQKVTMLSKDIVDDPYGREGKSLYAGLKDSLVKKYGEPTFGLERVGAKLWKESDEFYQCLAYSGCGIWAAGFEDKNGGQSIFLQLEGMGRGKGFVRLTYEGPKWSEAVDALKEKEAKTDADALLLNPRLSKIKPAFFVRIC
jgi:hypothetical protein